MVPLHLRKKNRFDPSVIYYLCEKENEKIWIIHCCTHPEKDFFYKCVGFRAIRGRWIMYQQWLAGPKSVLVRFCQPFRWLVSRLTLNSLVYSIGQLSPPTDFNILVRLGRILVWLILWFIAGPTLNGYIDIDVSPAQSIFESIFSSILWKPYQTNISDFVICFGTIQIYSI